MPTDSTVISQIIDPLEEDVEELERAVEGSLVHIAGPETITGLKTFTQPINALGGIIGPFSGEITGGVLTGNLDLNGFALLNVGASGLEQLANKGEANGYAPLGADGLVPSGYLGTGGVGAGDNFLADDGTYKPISAGSVSFGTQLANRIFAGPSSGSAAAPGFRVLVAADIPTLAQSKITNLVTDLASKVPMAREITEGAGLAGNVYDLSEDRTLEMGMPSALTVASESGVSGTTHSHAISSSANPGAAASILASDGSGYLTLVRLTLLDRLLINAATSNLFLKDTSTGFQAASTGIVTPQAGNAWRNTTYTSGVRGWNIDDDGNAEFNNIRVRGELAASVFKVNEIAATAGTFGVFFSAATVHADFTTPASTSSSFTFQAKNSDAGGMLFAVNDIVRFKTWTGSGISDSWGTITARTNNTTYTQYTATLNSGSTSATFRAGSAAVDYGPSGTGFITLSADGTVGSSPNLTMATHAGSPWSSQTTLLRLGNLNGSYGFATNIYGLGIGNYGVSNSWLTVDPTNGLRIFGAGGGVTLDGSGLQLTSTNASIGSGTNTISWKNVASQPTAYLWNYYDSVAHTSDLGLDGRLSTSDSTGFASISLSAQNNSSGHWARLRVYAFGTANAFEPDTAHLATEFSGVTFKGMSIGYSGGAAPTPTHMLEVYGNSWFRDGAIVPASTGTAQFALDTSPSTSLSIANNATATPFGNTNNFSGWFLVNDITTGNLAVFIQGSGNLVLVSQTSTEFSTTVDTASKTNVYLNSFVVTVQNKMGATRAYNIMALRTSPTS